MGRSREDLGVRGGVGTGGRRQPAQHANEHPETSPKAIAADHAARVGTMILRSVSKKVLFRDGDGVLAPQGVDPAMTMRYYGSSETATLPAAHRAATASKEDPPGSPRPQPATPSEISAYPTRSNP